MSNFNFSPWLHVRCGRKQLDIVDVYQNGGCMQDVNSMSVCYRLQTVRQLKLESSSALCGSQKTKRTST
jgi:hypothetical protein